jgi:peptidyl-prolyl cis-trans isomerase SurA
MRIIARTLLLMTALCCALALDARAQDAQRIVAVVNDEAISALDVSNRTRLTLISAGLPDSPESRRRIGAQVLRGLIDERLQMQEAARLGVNVTAEDVDEAVTRIEQNNRMRKGQLEQVLKQAGLPRAVLEAQLRPALAWSRLVQRRLRAQIQISDDEVQEVLDRLKANVGATEYLLSEIFLPIDSPDQDEEIKQGAFNLIQQMQRGVPFGALAQQFSQSASAAVGGDIGWVQEGQFEDVIEQAIKGIRPGEVTAPIRTVGGYYVYGLRNRRAIASPTPDDGTIGLTQLILPARNDREARSSMQLAQTLRDAVSGCEDLAKAAREAGAAAPAEPQRLRIGDVNPSIRDRIRNLKAGQAAEPLRAGNAVVLLMACTREDPPSGLPSSDEVQENLLRQRLDLLARRYLRDLRRQAYVDIRA